MARQKKGPSQPPKVGSREWKDQEFTWEEFEKELGELRSWLSKSTRSRRAWMYSVESWARGDR